MGVKDGKHWAIKIFEKPDHDAGIAAIETMKKEALVYL